MSFFFFFLLRDEIREDTMQIMKKRKMKKDTISVDHTTAILHVRPPGHNPWELNMNR